MLRRFVLLALNPLSVVLCYSHHCSSDDLLPKLVNKFCFCDEIGFFFWRAISGVVRGWDGACTMSSCASPLFWQIQYIVENHLSSKKTFKTSVAELNKVRDRPRLSYKKSSAPRLRSLPPCGRSPDAIQALHIPHMRAVLTALVRPGPVVSSRRPKGALTEFQT